MAPASFDPYYKWLGIPPEEQPPNHYRLLGIPLFESDLDVIENAAHRQMVYIRTFQTGKNADLSQKLLNELAAAKVCLMSRSKRAAYDEALSRQMRGEVDGAAPGLAGSVEGDSGVASDDSQASEDYSSAQESESAASEPSWSDSASEPVLDFSRPATERRDRSRVKKQPKRAQQPIVAILLLFGGLGVVAVFLIVLLLVLIFRKPKDNPNAGQSAGKATIGSTGSPNEVAGAFGTGAFGKSAGGGQAGKASAGGDPAKIQGPGDSKVPVVAESGKAASGKGTKSPKPDPNVPALSDGQSAETGSGVPGTNAAKSGGSPGGVPGSESAPGAVPPATASSDDKRTERIRAQFEMARQLLIARDANKAQAALGGLGGLNREPSLREEKEQLEAISRFIGEFWKSVRNGVTRVRGRLQPGGDNKGGDKKSGNNKSGENKGGENKGGDNKGGDNKGGDNTGGDKKGTETKGVNNKPDMGAGQKEEVQTENGSLPESEPPESQELEFLGEVFGIADEGSGAEFTLNGEPWMAPLLELPPKAAVALALLSMGDSDGFGRFYVAAFLLMDQKGDPDENRQIGMAMYRHAEMLSSEANMFILQEFRLEEEMLDEAAEKFPPDRLKVRQRPKGGAEKKTSQEK